MGFFFRDGFHMLKKTTLAVIGLAASGFASAGSMGPVCTPGNVTVGCDANRWDLGVQALYLKALYGPEKATQIIAEPDFNQLKNDWNWGFQAEGSYHYSTGNDVTVDWTHYSSDNSLGVFNGALLFPTPKGPLFIPSPYQIANQNKFDQVNVVLGQHVDVSAVKKMRFYGGMQYANIQSIITNYFSNTLPGAFSPITSVNVFNNSDFKGFGPVLGIDYSYDITSELSVTANGSGSILYGTSRINSGYIGLPVNVVVSGTTTYSALKSMVPSLEAKLGLNYAYTMANGVLNFNGGYEIVDYFNALQTTLVKPGFIISAVDTSITTNYGLYGPYLGVKYIGNA
jgi:hypothetical protein